MGLGWCVAGVVAAGIMLHITKVPDLASLDQERCIHEAYCPAHMPTDRPMVLSSCSQMLPPGRRPPPDMFSDPLLCRWHLWS